MADMRHIARPYANAVFQFAKEYQVISEWTDILKKLADISTNEHVVKLVKDSQVDRTIIVEIFQSILGEVSSKYTHNFLLCIAEHNRFLVLSDIYNIYDNTRLKDEGVIEISISSSSKLSKSIVCELEESLVNRFESQVDIQCNVDESLIGGALIKLGDHVIDGSIRGTLERLRHTLLAE